MRDDNAPLITKYQETQATEGYNFVLIKNEDEEQRYRETVSYTGLVGLKLLHDPNSTKYTLEVGPSESKIVILEASLNGFSYSSSIAREVVLGDSSLKKLCMTEDNKAQRGTDPIFCYTLQHPAGIFFVWQNETENLKYTEIVTFDMEGLQVVGHEDQEVVTIVVGPGEEESLKLTTTGASWKFGMSVSYSVEEVEE